MTCLKRLFSNRKVLLWLFSLNAVCLGALLLVVYDIGVDQTKPPQQRAYERWKNIRENFDAYQLEQSKRDSLLLKNVHGEQMDKVVGFDAIKHTDETNSSKIKMRIVEEERRIDEAVESADEPLNSVPPVPEFSETDIVPYLNQNLINRNLVLPRSKFSYKIVILTPVCDVEHLLGAYMDALNKLTYPHELISVYFGEDSSVDRTLDLAKLFADDLVTKYGFNDAAAFHLNNSGGVHGTWGDVHHRTSQYARRSHLAKARNMLLKKGMEKDHFDFVLWIDSDVKTLPANIIQHLLYAKSDVVVPACLFREGRFKKLFDKNSWRETPTSVEDQRQLPEDVLIVEGYSHTYRVFLPDLKAEGRVVPIDGVGGCVLMIKATCHRKGLLFPESVYNHHIETEGLAKMATNMGYTVRGLPWVEVFHH